MVHGPSGHYDYCDNPDPNVNLMVYLPRTGSNYCRNLQEFATKTLKLCGGIHLIQEGYSGLETTRETGDEAQGEQTLSKNQSRLSQPYALEICATEKRLTFFDHRTHHQCFTAKGLSQVAACTAMEHLPGFSVEWYWGPSFDSHDYPQV